MRIDNEIKLDFKDVLIRPKRSTLRSRSEVDLSRTFPFLHSKTEWTGVPIIAANMDTVGTFEMAQVLSKHNMITALHKHYTADEQIDFFRANPDIQRYAAVSAGTSDEDFNTISKVLEETEVNMICLDVANGYSEYFVDVVRKVREKFAKHTIIAGNVVTGEMVEELALTGADIIKVGIGPGSVCTTRKKTGVGYPQLSAVIECADAAHGLRAQIVSDGGCTVPGDIAKAFGAGADFVMIGGMLAGHDESAGDIVDIDGKKFKEFYGMSSAVAMHKYHGKVAEYRASEGKRVLVPYRGPVQDTLQDVLGGLRSACTYVGASQLKELSKRTTFIRVSQQTNEVYASTEIEQLLSKIQLQLGNTTTATKKASASASASSSGSSRVSRADMSDAARAECKGDDAIVADKNGAVLDENEDVHPIEITSESAANLNDKPSASNNKNNNNQTKTKSKSQTKPVSASPSSTPTATPAPAPAPASPTTTTATPAAAPAPAAGGKGGKGKAKK